MATTARITYRNCDNDQTVEKAWANPKATLLWSSRLRKRGKSGVRQSMYSKCATPTKMQELYSKMKRESAEAFHSATAKEDFKWDLKRGLVSIALGNDEGEEGACESTGPASKQPRCSPSSKNKKLVVSTKRVALMASSPATPERKKSQAGPVFSIFRSATKLPEPADGEGGGMDDPIEDSSQSDGVHDDDTGNSMREEDLAGRGDAQHGVPALARSPASSTTRRLTKALAVAHTPDGAGTSTALTRENLERNEAREQQQQQQRRRRQQLSQERGGWNPVPVFSRTGRSPLAAGGALHAARSLDLPTLPPAAAAAAVAAEQEQEQGASLSFEQAKDVVGDDDKDEPLVKGAAQAAIATTTAAAAEAAPRTKPALSSSEAKRQWAMVFQSPSRARRPPSPRAVTAAAATAASAAMDEDGGEDGAAKEGKEEAEEEEADESGSFPEMTYQSSWMINSDPTLRGVPNHRGPAQKPIKQKRNFSFRDMLYKADQLIIQHDAPMMKPGNNDHNKRARRAY